MQRVKEAIPPLVRLQRFDDGPFSGGKGLYKFTPLVFFSDESVHACGNGEVRFIDKRLAVATSKRTRQNIEAATDGVDVSPGFDLEFNRQRSFFYRHQNIVRAIR